MLRVFQLLSLAFLSFAGMSAHAKCPQLAGAWEGNCGVLGIDDFKDNLVIHQFACESISIHKGNQTEKAEIGGLYSSTNSGNSRSLSSGVSAWSFSYDGNQLVKYSTLLDRAGLGSHVGFGATAYKTTYEVNAAEELVITMNDYPADGPLVRSSTCVYSKAK